MSNTCAGSFSVPLDVYSKAFIIHVLYQSVRWACGSPPSLFFPRWHKESALIDRWDPMAAVQQLCASLAAQIAHARALGPDIFSEQESLGSCRSYFLPSQLSKTEPKDTRFARFSDWRAADVSSPTHPRPPAVAQLSAFYFRCQERARNSGNRPSLFWPRKIF